jgi:hypothetical protein
MWQPEDEQHLADLRKTFERMRQHALKMKIHSIGAENFLGFLVHHRGIEIDKNKAREITEALPLKNKKEQERPDSIF